MMRPTTSFKFSHALTGPYLPLPGSPPGWPFAGIGHWMIDVNANSEDWIRGLREWRHEHLVRLGFDDALYRDPRLQWAQRNFVHALAMVEDRYLYDPDAGRYTVSRYLDDLESRYGGIDSVLLWYIYPNVGVDDRHHFDFANDLPGGLAGLRGAIADFHQREVKVFLPTMPWDNGTRPHSEPDWELMAELVAATGADGINGDTYSGMPRAFLDACAKRGHAVVLERAELEQEGSAGSDSVGVQAQVARTAAHREHREPLEPRSQQRSAAHVLQRHRLYRVGERVGHLESAHAARRGDAASDRDYPAAVRAAHGQRRLDAIREDSADRRIRQPVPRHGTCSVDDRESQ
jgi:hypothetical protein